jgi:hypothetical protein
MMGIFHCFKSHGHPQVSLFNLNLLGNAYFFYSGADKIDSDDEDFTLLEMTWNMLEIAIIIDER